MPVPSRQKDKDLPTTQSMLDQLKQAGIKEADVDNIQLGYEWKQNKASSEVVDLNPTWYVRYQGKWRTYESLLSN